MKALDLVRHAAARIGGETPRLDAELIVAHAMGISREALLLGNLEAAADVAEPFIARRAAGEPVAYILGRQEFWSLDLEVAPGILIPRADTETLIVAAQRLFPAGRRLAILDLGTGSGALALAALSEWTGATALATDVSDTALAVAARNAARLGFAPRCRFLKADWAQGVEGRFTLILSNPPYIGEQEALGAGVREYEPHGALFAGRDGLDAYRRIVAALPALLEAEGAAILEIGWTQAEAVLALGRTHGLAGAVERDLADRDRAIIFRHADAAF
ncbi:peptide chain release factor N(5)-glutamine methyltransferase [Sphingosinicella soli]|uniref:Release factor glutamine methyltransferase n=1 Tax=Sphingosinicella soli TaxID=333708 RepID=A0A7W7F7L2_9SPHN|nr:peptide chain release factor N(5)-glutamine methyltransferase [Sphingosinicella soli]MBB4633561.1 release factor glutamine methyltransferase [Sphingosinicella soli]